MNVFFSYILCMLIGSAVMIAPFILGYYLITDGFRGRNNRRKTKKLLIRNIIIGKFKP